MWPLPETDSYCRRIAAPPFVDLLHLSLNAAFLDIPSGAWYSCQFLPNLVLYYTYSSIFYRVLISGVLHKFFQTGLDVHLENIESLEQCHIHNVFDLV